MQQTITSLNEHADVLLVMVYLLAVAVTGLMIYFVKNILSKLRTVAIKLEDHTGSLIKLDDDMTNLKKDIESAQKDAKAANLKSEQIEKNYIKKFEGLSGDIKLMGSELATTLMEDNHKLHSAIQDVKMDMITKFMGKGECDKIHNKMEKTLEKMETKINAD